MNQSVKRAAAAVSPVGFASGCFQSVDDHELCMRILALPLGEASRARMQSLADSIVPGKFGQLSRQRRDELIRFARQHGAMPKQKKRKAIADVGHAPDVYDSRETSGTLRAAAIIASQVPKLGGTMPTPPPRRGQW